MEAVKMQLPSKGFSIRSKTAHKHARNYSLEYVDLYKRTYDMNNSLWLLGQLSVELDLDIIEVIEAWERKEDGDTE